MNSLADSSRSTNFVFEPSLFEDFNPASKPLYSKSIQAYDESAVGKKILKDIPTSDTSSRSGLLKKNKPHKKTVFFEENNSLEERINIIENQLSFYSVKPIFIVIVNVTSSLGMRLGMPLGCGIGLGVSWLVSVPLGLSKICLGLVQAIGGVALSIIIAIPGICQNEASRRFFFRVCKHIPHGIGNIVAGIFEIMPLIGAGTFAIRLLKTSQAKGVNARTNIDQFMKHPAFKFYPYEHSSSENVPGFCEEYDSD